MKLYGALENAELEVLASDPSATVQGRVYYNSTTSRFMLDDGTNKRALLRNDGFAVLGTSGTAANNIRFHRGANTVLQLVAGNDTTAEGTLSTALAQLSARTENYSTAGRPAAGNAGRVIYDSSLGALYVDTGAAWAAVSGNAPAMVVRKFAPGATSYVPTAGTKRIRLKMLGGGGGGGGSGPTAAGSGTAGGATTFGASYQALGGAGGNQNSRGSAGGAYIAPTSVITGVYGGTGHAATTGTAVTGGNGGASFYGGGGSGGGGTNAGDQIGAASNVSGAGGGGAAMYGTSGFAGAGGGAGAYIEDVIYNPTTTTISVGGGGAGGGSSAGGYSGGSGADGLLVIEEEF